MKVIRNEQGTLMAPVPIQAAPYIQGIIPGKLGSVNAALAQQERVRMLKLYERFRAYLQPIKFYNGRTVWEVRFHPGSPWKNGPRLAGAWMALQYNYERNRCFPGHDPLEKGDGHLLHKVDELERQQNISQERKDAEIKRKLGATDEGNADTQ